MKVISDISCYGDSVGIARLYASGGDPAYSYLWDNGETSIIANALTSGYHSVVLTDDWGCEVYLDGVLNANAHPLDTFFNNVSGGLHYITVVDTSSSCSVPIPVVISAPGFPLQALVSNSTNTCYGSDLGFAIGSSAGGTPGYDYEWFDIGFNSLGTNDTIFNLSAGSYYLRVEDDNGCDTITSVNVVEPQVPLDGSPQVFNVKCKGDSTGMIVGDASGSWAPYTYEWFDQSFNLLQSSTNSYTRDTLANLEKGIYILTITDFEGCSI
jgi:hypothetical protein